MKGEGEKREYQRGSVGMMLGVNLGRKGRKGEEKGKMGDKEEGIRKERWDADQGKLIGAREGEKRWR